MKPAEAEGSESTEFNNTGKNDNTLAARERKNGI
jgi:hypothetical protein